MPVSMTSMATVNSRTRMFRSPMAWGESSVSGIIRVVSSTSHSEMPSTPRWKRMPSAGTQSLFTSIWKPAWAVSKSTRISRDTRKVTSETRKPIPRWMDSSSLGMSGDQHGAQDGQQRRPGQDTHYLMLTRCLTMVFGIPARDR